MITNYDLIGLIFCTILGYLGIVNFAYFLFNGFYGGKLSYWSFYLLNPEFKKRRRK